MDLVGKGGKGGEAGWSDECHVRRLAGIAGLDRNDGCFLVGAGR